MNRPTKWVLVNGLFPNQMDAAKNAAKTVINTLSAKDWVSINFYKLVKLIFLRVDFYFESILEI